MTLNRRKKKAKRQKLPSMKSLRTKAWYLFSIWVRSNGADDFGRVACYTCGRVYHWTDLNAGHYRHDSHDFDPMNVKAQCPGCNLYESGRSDNFYLHLVQEYGKVRAEELRTRPKWNAYNRKELNDIIIKYSPKP